MPTETTDCTWCILHNIRNCPYYDKHGEFWDKSHGVDECCPDYMTQDDAREQAGCDKLHEFFENGGRNE